VIADVAVSVVPKERGEMAAGMNDTFRQVGIAVGHRRLGSDLRRQRRRRGPPAGRGPPGVPEGGLGRRPRGVPRGLNDVLTLGALVSFAGAVLALWRWERDIEREPAEPEGTPESAALREQATA
jgi:hypothetical protein